MKIKVKIAGIRRLPRGFEGRKEVHVDFPGGSVRDLLQQLFPNPAPDNIEIFLDYRISPDLGVVVNGTLISDSNRDNFRLKEGDSVELISSPG
jgi:hypothetical protein